MTSVQREFADGEVVPGTRYRVVGLIGSGGMGSVYEVEHQELGKRFVLKALLRSLTNRDDLVHRLRNEWRALGRLEHPNIVSVTDAGVTTTGVPYYVMERLQGETLSGRLRRERRLRLPDALGIAADVLDGLSAAHHIGVVHRDVKPPNIFLVGGRVAKLLDFGIAKMLDPGASQITGRGVAIGTPRYMAPEQATGGTVDARTDLYATGLILYEMIAGSGPFDAARDANELFLAHLAQDVPPVSSRAAGVPAELDQWLARLLAKKAEDRPSDAAAVAAELRALRRRWSGAPPPSEPSRPEDRTIPGGPFDTLEAAETVASDRRTGAHRDPHGPLNDATTHTGMGPHGTEAQSGQTLRLSTLQVEDAFEPPEAATRTAAPVALPGHQETPPPVEPGRQPVRPPGPAGRRTWALASIALGALVAVAAAVLGRARVSSPSGELGGSSPVNAGATAPALAFASAFPPDPPAPSSVSPRAAPSEATPAPVPVPGAAPHRVPVPVAVRRPSPGHPATPASPPAPVDTAALPGSGL